MGLSTYRIAKEIFNVEKLSKREVFRLSKGQGLSQFRGQFTSGVMWSKLNSLERYRIEFEAHKDQLTTLQFIQLEHQYLLTSSLDNYVKVFDKESFALVCSLNINHPLPIQWNLNLSKNFRARRRIMFAMRILDIIFKKYRDQISYGEERNLKINNFLNRILQERGLDVLLQKSGGDPQRPGPPQESATLKAGGKQIILMRDEYEPRDLKAEKYRKLFRDELSGQSLKKLEQFKRIAQVQQVWQREERQEKHVDEDVQRLMETLNQRSKMEDHNRRQIEDREQISNLLDVNYQKKILDTNKEHEVTRNPKLKHLVQEFRAIDQRQSVGKKVSHTSQNQPQTQLERQQLEK